jgi:hypothetical protein
MGAVRGVFCQDAGAAYPLEDRVFQGLGKSYKEAGWGEFHTLVVILKI